MQRPFLRGCIGSRWMSTMFNTNDVLASGEESTNWLFNFQPSLELPLVLCVPCPISQDSGHPSSGVQSILFSHLLSRDGINKSMDPALTGLWCPPASYFSSCQSTRTLICWNTLMHCVTPWRMFIKLFFNEKQGSIADRGDSCIPTPMHLC